MKDDIVSIAYELDGLCEGMQTTFCFPFFCYSVAIVESIIHSKGKSISYKVEASGCHPIGIIRISNKPIDFLIITRSKKVFLTCVCVPKAIVAWEKI